MDEEREILNEILGDDIATVKIIPYKEYKGNGKKISTDFDRKNNMKIDRYRTAEGLIDVATPWIAAPLEVGDLDLWGEACKKSTNLTYAEVKSIYEKLKQDKIREKIEMSKLSKETKSALLEEYKKTVAERKIAQIKEDGAGEKLRKEDKRIHNYWSGKTATMILRTLLDRVERRHYGNIKEALSIVKNEISEKKYEDVVDYLTRLGFEGIN